MAGGQQGRSVRARAASDIDDRCAGPWLSEAQSPSIESAGEIAGALVELPAEPRTLRVIMGMLKPP